MPLLKSLRLQISDFHPIRLSKCIVETGFSKLVGIYFNQEVGGVVISRKIFGPVEFLDFWIEEGFDFFVGENINNLLFMVSSKKFYPQKKAVIFYWGFTSDRNCLCFEEPQQLFSKTYGSSFSTLDF